MEKVPDLLLFTKCRDFLYYSHSHKPSSTSYNHIYKANLSYQKSLKGNKYQHFPINYYQKAKTLLGSKQNLRSHYYYKQDFQNSKSMETIKRVQKYQTENYFRKPHILLRQNKTCENMYKQQSIKRETCFQTFQNDSSEAHCLKEINLQEKNRNWRNNSQKKNTNLQQQVPNDLKIKYYKEIKQQKRNKQIKENTMYVQNMKMRNALSQISAKMQDLNKQSENGQVQRCINTLQLIDELTQIKIQNIEINKEYLSKLNHIVNQYQPIQQLDEKRGQFCKNKVKIFDTKMESKRR